MSNLEKVFAGCKVINSDSFVVDYTNDNDKSIARRGVEITQHAGTGDRYLSQA